MLASAVLASAPAGAMYSGWPRRSAITGAADSLILKTDS